MHHRKPHSCAFPVFFRCKIRLKNFIHKKIFYTMSGVRNRQFRIPARIQVCELIKIIRPYFCFFKTYFKRPSGLFHGMFGICGQIHYKLMNLGWISDNGSAVFVKTGSYFYG